MPSGPIKWRFTLYRGAARVLTVSVTDDDGNVVNTSGWAWQFTGRLKENDPDPAPIQKTGTVGDGSAGLILVPVTKADSLSWVASAYAVSLERTDTGQEDLLAKGQMSMTADIKNATPSS